MSSVKSKAIFIGYFNPFHIGHAYVILESSKLVDEILVFVMSHQPMDYTVLAGLDDRRNIIKKWIAHNKKYLHGLVHVYEEDKQTPRSLITDKGYTTKICGTDRFNTQLSKRNLLEMGLSVKNFIVVARPPFELNEAVRAFCDKFEKQIIFIPASKNKKIAGANSGDIRDMLSKNETIKGTVPREIEEDIINSYKQSPTNSN